MVDTVQRAKGPVGGAPHIFDRRAGVVEVYDLKPREVAVVRAEVGSSGLASAIRDALLAVSQAMGEAGVGLAGPPFARYLEWNATGVVAEIGFPVLRAAPRVGPVGPSRLPGGRVASIVHVGPYETIGKTYALLQAWLIETGRGEMGPMWELYWSDPLAEPNPATRHTEIVMPIDRLG